MKSATGAQRSSEYFLIDKGWQSVPNKLFSIFQPYIVVVCEAAVKQKPVRLLHFPSCDLLPEHLHNSLRSRELSKRASFSSLYTPFILDVDFRSVQFRSEAICKPYSTAFIWIAKGGAEVIGLEQAQKQRKWPHQIILLCLG